MASYVVPAIAFGVGLVAGYVLFRRSHHQPRSVKAEAPVAASATGKKLAENAKAATPGRGEHKMVLVVRMDLKMGSGKIAAQCSHGALLWHRLGSPVTHYLSRPATLGAYKTAQKRSEGDVKAWSKTGQAKVALKCQTLEEMHRLAQLAEEAGVVNYTVVDAGRTQIAEGSETVLAIGPAPKEVIDKITGHLKLL